MVATETKMNEHPGVSPAAHPEFRVLAPLLAFVAPLFSRLSDDAYAAATADVAWIAFKLEAAGLVRDEAERSRLLDALAPLEAEAYASFRNEVLVAGMPFAALPVESLYKRWSNAEGNAFGAARGLYLGDPARHMIALYEQLAVEVPQKFADMPDHLSLELELLSLLLEADNAPAAREFAADHLDWLTDYDHVLASRAEAVAVNERFAQKRRQATVRGIAFLRALLVVVERAVALVSERSASEEVRTASVPA